MSNNPSEGATVPGRRIASNEDPALYANDFSAGAQVGNYVVDALLSKGGFAAVYRAHHVTLGRAAALKVLHRSLVSSPTILKRFEQEAQAVNLIRHPNIVDIYEFGELDDGRPYMVMELLSGCDLDRYVNERGRLAPDALLDLFEPLCEALTAAHLRGIIHRDVKTSNIFLDDSKGRRRLVLLDFGIAKLLDPDGPGLTTSHNNMLGTPSCMAPEQITGGVVDARTDVYALGVLLFRLLTGELPFNEESGTQMRYMHLHGPRPAPSMRVPSLGAFDPVVRQAMQIDRRERFESSREFLRALRVAVAGGAVGAGSRAVGLFLDVRVAPEAMEDPDDALLLDIDAVLRIVSEPLAASGFMIAFQSGNQVLYARRLEGDEVIIRREAVATAQTLRKAIDARPARDARVHVNLCLHAAELSIDGGASAMGQLSCLGDWVIDADLPGVVATSAAIAGISVETEAIAGQPQLVLLRELG